VHPERYVSTYLIPITVTVVKVLHFNDGVKLYVGHSSRMWCLPHEKCDPNSLYFFSNLDFDWMLVNRKPSLTWPSLVRDDVDLMHRCMSHTDVPVQIYLANRLASVGCIVATMVGLNVSSRINCQVCRSVDDIQQAR